MELLHIVPAFILLTLLILFIAYIEKRKVNLSQGFVTFCGFAELGILVIIVKTALQR